MICSQILTPIQVRQIYQSRQICTMGWVIDPVLSTAMLWGADPFFLEMRTTNPSQVLGQCIDYGAMFHTAYMAMNGQVGLDPAKQAVMTGFDAGGTDKTILRKLLKDVFILLLRKHF